MKTPILEANNLNKLSTYGGFFGEWKALYFEEILTFCRRENSPWRYDFVLRNKEKEKKKHLKNPQQTLIHLEILFPFTMLNVNINVVYR